jgi:diguanylate cyclase (GGDEF)-like protein/PAS domain S-box-containing protein
MERSLSEILDNLFDEAVYFVDADRRITFWNKSAERLTGFTSEEVVGSRCMDNILTHVDDQGRRLCFDGCPLTKVMEDGLAREAEVYLHHKDGHRIPIRARILPFLGQSGDIVGGIEIFTDRRQSRDLLDRMQELERLALLDTLTQLSNRKHIESELAAVFKMQERLGLSFGLLFIDIDHFKRINDTYGHGTGDTVLKMTARTLASSVREFDLIGRWGGEEFVVIARARNVEDLFAVAERLRVMVGQSYIDHSGKRIQVTISVGAAMALPGEEPCDLIRRADGLLYRSKEAGRNRTTLG